MLPALDPRTRDVVLSLDGAGHNSNAGSPLKERDPALAALNLASGTPNAV